MRRRVAQKRMWLQEGRKSKNQCWAVFIFYGRPFSVALTHFIPIFSFNTPGNYQKTLRLSADFRGYRKGWNVFSSNNKWIKAKKPSNLIQPKSSNTGRPHFEKLDTPWYTLKHFTLKKPATKHKTTSRCPASFPFLKFLKKLSEKKLQHKAFCIYNTRNC